MTVTESENLGSIISRAQEGDKEAFADLYSLYFTPIYRYIFFRIGNKVEADDLVQDVFLKAFSSISRYSYNGTSPLAYFYTIARNTLIDWRRKKKTDLLDEETEAGMKDGNPGPEELAITSEEGQKAFSLLSKLPEDQRDAISLRFVSEFSTKEVAEVLGKSETAVRQLQSRGLKKLRELLS